MQELREFFYHDSRLTQNYLSQIEDGLIEYQLDNKQENNPNNSFEISTGALGQLLQNVVGVPLPDLSYKRNGKNVTIRASEFKTHSKVSQFTRLLKYIEPALSQLDRPINIEEWTNLKENQFIKFTCTLKVSNLYLFSNFTRRIGQVPLFMNKNKDDEFNNYVQHTEFIESKRKEKVILQPHFSPNKAKYFFVSDIQKTFLEEGIELTDLNKQEFIVVGKIDYKLSTSEKEIIFDLTETGMLEVMKSKEIKEFIKQFNKKTDQPMMKKFLSTEQDIYATKPAIIFKPIAIYKA